jgi:hypothetical protein
MSSQYVREKILEFLVDEVPTESVIDLTSEFLELEDFLTEAGLSNGDPWLGVQFLGSEELPVDIRGTNLRGKYREVGVVFLHVVAVASVGVHNAILTRAEAIRNKLRGQRIDSILIESVSPANFGEGITLSFSGGYTAAVIQVDYQRDLDL